MASFDEFMAEVRAMAAEADAALRAKPMVRPVAAAIKFRDVRFMMTPFPRGCMIGATLTTAPAPDKSLQF